MIKRVPLLDPTTNQQFVLNGETTDIVPRSRTVYIDGDGNTYDPSQRKIRFDELPESGVLELPHVTWWSDDDPILEILPDGSIASTQDVDLSTSSQPMTVKAVVWCCLDESQYRDDVFSGSDHEKDGD
jgi:hypothetical protein